MREVLTNKDNGAEAEMEDEKNWDDPPPKKTNHQSEQEVAQSRA